MVDESFDRFAGETACLDALGEDVAAFVAPAKLGDEAVLDVAFFVGARRAVGMRPRQHGFILLPGERATFNFGVGDAEKTGRMRLNLVAGVRQDVRDYFMEIIRERGLEAELGKSVRVLFTATKDDYFPAFNALMRETDVLWTKPSELCFYAGLGIPIVMSPPLGAHEESNQATLMRAGASYRQEDPRAVAEWLSDWTNNGLLAIGAVNGYLNVSNRGTENIKRVLFASDRSNVQLEAIPPVLRYERVPRE